MMLFGYCQICSLKFSFFGVDFIKYLGNTLNHVLRELYSDNTKGVLELERNSEIGQILIQFERVINSLAMIIMIKKGVLTHLSMSIGSVLGMFSEGIPVFMYGLQ